MTPGFDSAQHAYDTAEPDNTDVCEGCEDNGCGTCDMDCCDGCLIVNYEEDPDEARDRAYAYNED